MGDGNFHVILIFDGNNADEMRRMKEFSTVLARYETIGAMLISVVFSNS